MWEKKIWKVYKKINRKIFKNDLAFSNVKLQMPQPQPTEGTKRTLLKCRDKDDHQALKQRSTDQGLVTWRCTHVCLPQSINFTSSTLS